MFGVFFLYCHSNKFLHRKGIHREFDRLFTFYPVRRHNVEWHNLSSLAVMKFLRGIDKNSQLNFAISRII